MSGAIGFFKLIAGLKTKFLACLGIDGKHCVLVALLGLGFEDFRMLGMGRRIRSGDFQFHRH